MSPQLILTIAPDCDGRPTLWISLRGVDGTPGPARKVAVDLDYRLATFVTAMQALARTKLAAVESPAVESAADGD